MRPTAPAQLTFTTCGNHGAKRRGRRLRVWCDIQHWWQSFAYHMYWMSSVSQVLQDLSYSCAVFLLATCRVCLVICSQLKEQGSQVSKAKPGPIIWEEVYFSHVLKYNTLGPNWLFVRCSFAQIQHLLWLHVSRTQKSELYFVFGAQNKDKMCIRYTSTMQGIFLQIQHSNRNQGLVLIQNKVDKWYAWARLTP